MGHSQRLFEKQCVFLSVLAATGSVPTAAENAGVSRWTPYRWRQTDAQFAAAWGEAVQRGPHEIRTEAIRRALHGTEQPVFYKGQQVGTRTRPSDGLLLHLLKRGERTAQEAEQAAERQRAHRTPAQHEPGVMTFEYEDGSVETLAETQRRQAYLRGLRERAAAGDADAQRAWEQEREVEKRRGCWDGQ